MLRVPVQFQLETWAHYRKDVGDLWARHYIEFKPFHKNKLPFGPDEATYARLDQEGALQILTARAGGELVGYCLVALRRHPHYEAVCGFEDSYWLHPDYRRGLTGVKLIKESREALAKRGITVSYWMTKEFINMGKLFERLGASKCDTVYAFGLED